MAIVGSAQVLIRPTFSNMQKEIRKELEGMGEQVGAEAGQRAGQSLGDRLATWGKRGAMVAGGAIAAVTGTALVKGFGRLQAIENAQAKLRGLGNDADAVRQIMDDALASVKGTAFGLGEAATVAASAVAAGLEPGEALAGHLTNIANTASAAGVSMEEMGAVFNKAATQANGVQNDVISQLADRGIPIYQALADQMGVTAGEVFKLASEGKVNFETFAAAAEQASGTVAAEMGNTLSGSFQNTLAALGRVGANLMSGVYPYFADFFQGAMDFLGPLEDKAVVVGEAIGEWMTRGAEGLKSFIDEFRNGEGLGGRFADMLGRIRDGAVGLFDLIVKGDFSGALRNAFGWEEDAPIVGTLLTIRDVIGSIAEWITGTAIPAIADFGKWLVSVRGWLIPLAGAVLGVAAAWKTYQITMTIVQGVTKAYTAVQAALNAVMAMNPIGLIVLALVGLAAAFTVAWHRSETFREVVTAAWEGIKNAASSAWDWLKGAFEWIKDGIASVGDWFSDRGAQIAAAWDAVRAGLAAGWAWIDTNVLAPIRAALKVVSDVFTVTAAIIGIGWDMARVALATGWAWIDANVFAPVRAGIALVGQWFSARGAEIAAAWELVRGALAAGWAWIDANVFSIFRAGIENLKNNFTLAVGAIKAVWDSIKGAFSAAWGWIDRNVFSLFRAGAENLRGGVTRSVDGIKSVWDGIKGAFRAVWDWVDGNVFEPFRRGLDRVKGWVQSAVDSVKSMWETLKAAFAAPINWVIREVWNDGIVRVFNSVADAIPGVTTRLSEMSEIGVPATSSGGSGGRPLAARAKGGPVRPGQPYLVGEEGPEIIWPDRAGYVSTAAQSRRIQDQWSGANPPHGGLGGWFSDRWDNIKSGARWVADGVRDAAGNVVKWVRGGLAKAAGIVLDPVKSLIGQHLGGSGFGGIIGQAATSSIDTLMDWIRGQDEGAAPDAGGRSLRGALPYVNNAAHALADAVGGVRTMQAFNQSMAGGHPAGKAVDFIDSVEKLNRLADVISGGGHFDNFNYMAWQGRLWSPGRGWRAQGRGFGNDPMHRWHLHAEWHDQGGLLQPGVSMLANGTGKPEPVLTAGQWRDISTLAAKGATGPEYLVIVDADRQLIGRMQVEADHRISYRQKQSDRVGPLAR